MNKKILVQVTEAGSTVPECYEASDMKDAFALIKSFSESMEYEGTTWEMKISPLYCQ
jgi:hypothetical protein